MRAKHLRTRELRFLAFMLVNLLCIAGFLSSGFETLREQTGGWRRVDMDMLSTRMKTGDLVKHEAHWYRPAKNGRGGGK